MSSIRDQQFEIQQDTTVFSFVSISIILLAFFIALNTTAIHKRTDKVSLENISEQEATSISVFTRIAKEDAIKKSSKKLNIAFSEVIPNAIIVPDIKKKSVQLTFTPSDLFIESSNEIRALALPLLDLVYDQAKSLNAKVTITSFDSNESQKQAVERAQTIYRLLFDSGIPTKDITLKGQSTDGPAQIIINFFLS